jgi:hypothetical protein
MEHLAYLPFPGLVDCFMLGRVKEALAATSLNQEKIKNTWVDRGHQDYRLEEYATAFQQ